MKKVYKNLKETYLEVIKYLPVIFTNNNNDINNNNNNNKNNNNHY